MIQKKLTIAGILILALFGALLLAAWVLPWKVEVGHRLTQLLDAKGFQGIKLTLGDIGLRKTTLRDVSIGAETPLVLKDIDLDYTLTDLWHRNLRGVTVRGLALQVVNKNGKWFVIGLENLKGAADASAEFALPVTREDFAFLPFDTLAIADSNVQVTSDRLQAGFPLSLTLDKTAVPKIDYAADSVSLKINAIDVATGKVTVKAQVDPIQKAWQGTWAIDDIAVTGTPLPVQSLQGAGTVTAKADQAIINGTVKSADNIYRFTFRLEQHFSGTTPSTLTIVSAAMPWKGGSIGLKNTKITLGSKQALRLNVLVDKVSIDEVLQSVTGKRVSATGVFSGTVPVVINANGSLSFPQGGLTAEAPGTISMPAESLPGSGQQIELVRNILKNLQYSVFALTLNGSGDKGMTVTLSLEGHNPDVDHGRPVKLNVNLTGDVLDFIQQNMMLLNDPKSFVKQSQ